ncbi:hypothetical protein AXG93_855s1130 [Marchantia polymorpha subsp. ruderalis]|uniref:Uncharacterized protein n=1 Tax=Marchantia polymorpha subsp. ruderalis TaxID=1480154 RepID=A0A176VWM8_MARPO|nr:hypothetical protein AXG93_855s1130 [Marchantia polymorpha subsp. ruderalis]
MCPRISDEWLLMVVDLSSRSGFRWGLGCTLWIYQVKDQMLRSQDRQEESGVATGKILCHLHVWLDYRGITEKHPWDVNSRQLQPCGAAGKDREAHFRDSHSRSAKGWLNFPKEGDAGTEGLPKLGRYLATPEAVLWGRKHLHLES